MRPRSSSPKKPTEQVVKDIRRATRRHFSAQDKIRGIMDHAKGKRRLAGDTARAATSDEVKDLRREASALKECVADLTLENRLLNKA